MSSERPPARPAFEPKKNRKKTNKATSKPSDQATSDSKSATPEQKVKTTPASSKPKKDTKRRYTREETAIPEKVSQRMLSRMVVLAGLPLLMGIGTFIGSYFIITQDLFVFPHTVVVIISMGFFGLSVVGLSYGVLSASWDEEVSGSIVGWQEFKVNLGRMQDGWKAARQKNQKN